VSGAAGVFVAGVEHPARTAMVQAASSRRGMGSPRIVTAV
jgi:hypothetical protein